MRVCWQGQTGWAVFGAGGTGKVTPPPERALLLLLGKLGFAYVRQKPGMGRAALDEVGAGLGQAEGSVHCQADIGGVAVLLAVILPPADGAQGQRLGRLQRLVAAGGQRKLAI